MTLTLIDCTGPFTDPDGTPSNGTVIATPTAEITNGGTTVPIVDETLNVVNGEVDPPVSLYGFDDGDSLPRNQGYWFRERLGQRPAPPYVLIIPSAAPGGTVALGSLPRATQIPAQYFATVDEETVNRLTSLDQVAKAQGDLDLNENFIHSLAGGELSQDAANLSQVGGAWITDASTWTRTSNTTFTVPGNIAVFYPKGTKLKWSESGTVKYGVVASAVFTSLTTITMIATSDYSMGASPDSGTACTSYGNPFGFPTSFNFTPTGVTGFTGQSGPVCWWSVQGGICTVNVFWLGDGTSNANTLALTSPATASQLASASAWVKDNGTFAPGLLFVTSGASTLQFTHNGSPTGFTTSGSKNGSAQIDIPL